MATWKDENEKQEYTLKQVLKEIENQYSLYSLLGNDYFLEDEPKDKNDNNLK